MLEAIRSDEDPVVLLQTAAQDHIPVDPSSPKDDTKGKSRIVPESKDRPIIDAIIEEIQDQQWYNDQIVHRRTVEAKEGVPGQLVKF